MPTKCGRLRYEDIVAGRTGFQVDSFFAKGNRLIATGKIRRIMFTGRPSKSSWYGSPMAPSLTPDGLPGAFILSTIGIFERLPSSSSERARYYTFATLAAARRYLRQNGVEILPQAIYDKLVGDTKRVLQELSAEKMLRNSSYGAFGSRSPQPVDKIFASVKRSRDLVKELRDGKSPEERRAAVSTTASESV